MANRDGSVDSRSHTSTAGLRGGFASTRPAALYVGTAVAVVWDVVAFVHLFHAPLVGEGVGFWWPWAWLLLATVPLGLSNKSGRATPWWTWALLGIGVLAVASATKGIALSIWAALAIVVWPDQGRPWWLVFGGLAIIHALAQWGLFLTWWHLPTIITIAITWVTGLGMLVSVRGSNWRSAA